MTFTMYNETLNVSLNAPRRTEVFSHIIPLALNGILDDLAMLWVFKRNDTEIFLLVS